LADKLNVPRETNQMKTYTKCPICDGKTFIDFIQCKDNTGSNDTFNICKCSCCKFAFTNPIPLQSDIAKYYESKDYISHSNTSKGLVNFLYQGIRNYTLDRKVALLQKLSDGKNLLDIGSGTGEFLGRTKKAKFIVTGIEPSKTGKDQTKDNFGIDVNDEHHLANMEDGKFDFITMWHVLEHVYNLNKRVAELKRLIKNDGHIIIAVPNLTSFDAAKYEKHWAAYDLPRHLYHFSPNDISSLVEKHDMKVTQVLPMKFDSFYVSMLSEKYKTGSTNLFSSFIAGLRSNIHGISKQQCSSQIYIIKNA
jgi:2-polyprenyl-3-methyl-5-hydroxy-6-metoxy-1,4-benzoquinol methylase